MKKGRKLHNVLIEMLEKLLCRSYLLTKIYVNFFKKMTIDEFSMVDLPEGSKVLVIGCGSIPHTILTLAKVKRWSFVGIDRDKEAVERAKRVIKLFKLDGKVMIKEGDGMDFDVSGYDLIVIAYGVEPKEEILLRVWKEVDVGTRILYRSAWEATNPIYGKENLPEDLHVKNIFYRPDLVKSILLVKK